MLRFLGLGDGKNCDCWRFLAFLLKYGNVNCHEKREGKKVNIGDCYGVFASLWDVVDTNFSNGDKFLHLTQNKYELS